MARTVHANNLLEVQKQSAWLVDFVKIVIDPSDPDKIVRLCTHYENVTIGSEDYLAVGQFLGFSDISDDLEAKDNSLSISLSGIDNTFSAIALDNELAGSLIEVSRGFLNDATGVLVADPDVRWSGLVNGSEIVTENEFEDSDKISITVECKSLLSTVIGKEYGRFSSDKGVSDKSMEFVPSLRNFQPFFGKEN